jgi:16S rRNA (guanine(966)-N(2))-methyltransferase RsmD
LNGNPPAGTRPTSDKLRETLFNILGSAVEDSTFLDCCAGAGGIGIEAISRGARMVYFVERSRRACSVIRENLESLDVTTGFRILEMEAAKALETLGREHVGFNIAFLDPPYEREDLYDRCLGLFEREALLIDEGVLVLEHSKRFAAPDGKGALMKYRQLTQGDSALAFYRKPNE